MISRIAQKHTFYTEIAKLLAAGLGIREAAAVLRETHVPAQQLQLLDGLDEGLAKGLSITDAYARSDASITTLERSIISAGEKGGRLAPAFQHLAEYYGLLESTRRHIIRSLLYPLAILHLGIFVSVVPMAFLNGDGTNVLSRLLITFLICYLAGGLLFWGAKASLKLASTHAQVDALINKIPFIGKARRNLAMARFTKVYHTCLLAGLTISETVATASSASHSGHILQAGSKLETAALAGNALGPVFIAEPVFPKTFARSYSTAETSGSLDRDMDRWSNVFQQEAETATRNMADILPKILYGIVVIYVAWTILGFWSNYYGALDNIGE